MYGCEPSTAAPATESFRTGKRCAKFDAWEPSFVDGCGAKLILEEMWPLASQLLSGAIAVDPAAAAAAVKIVLERNRVVAEGASGCAVAAALASGKAGQPGRKRRVVCVLSGGGIDSAKLMQILAGCPAAGGPEVATSFVCPYQVTTPCTGATAAATLDIRAGAKHAAQWRIILGFAAGLASAALLLRRPSVASITR